MGEEQDKAFLKLVNEVKDLSQKKKKEFFFGTNPPLVLDEWGHSPVRYDSDSFSQGIVKGTEISENKLSVKERETGLVVHSLYGLMDGISSINTEEVEKIRNDIFEVLDNEKIELEKLSQNCAKTLLAQRDSRIIELEKMKIDFEIRLKEKEIYELQVDMSPEKETLLTGLKNLKETKLFPLLQKGIEMFEKEKKILEVDRQVLGFSERVNYIESRLIEFRELADNNGS